jgi:ABC-type multidrug transport system fused ATPase/permease subunit
MGEPAVSLNDLRVTSAGLRALKLRSDSTEDSVILDGVDREVEQGGMLSILGESGGGKSTLLRAICRLIDVDSGSVKVNGRDVRDWPVSELRRHAVYVPQRSHLFGGSVRDELTAALAWGKQQSDDAALKDVLDSMALDTSLDRDASELSEGQRQRLCLARALLLKPGILLLDEPTGALDVRTAREMLTALLEWKQQHNATLLCVTHRPADLETLQGHVIALLKGRVAGHYTAAEVLEGSVAESVGAFLGSSPREVSS